MRELILGGVKSGKSRLAEQRAQESDLDVFVIATAEALDKEMYARIELHRQQRPGHWQVTEEPLHLARALTVQAAEGHCIIVDCLTLWLTNLLAQEQEFDREVNALLNVLPNLPGHIIFVSNETNMGVTPVDKLSRRFCDEAGRLHQRLATQCHRVSLMVAGIPQIIKEEVNIK